MSDLFWPGAERAGDLMSNAALLRAMISVEQAWLDALAEAGIAPASAPLSELVGTDDVAGLSEAAEATGNPVPALATLLRERAAGAGATWVHRGLTSQDVVDSALMVGLRDVLTRIGAESASQVESLLGLIEAHRETPMPGRTLTQSAVPMTFGLKAANWLTGILDAAENVAAIGYPVQLGGAAGTLAAAVELAGGDVDRALALVTATAERLGLAAVPAWHTSRAPFTSIADALVGTTDALGRIAGDVLTLSRSEILELGEPTGGGSSTMPHKRNPALSVLVKRAAISAPGHASTVHLAGALAHDERSAGPWHAEWAALRDLARSAVVASSQMSEVLAGLLVDVEQMAAAVDAARDDLTAEQRSMAAFARRDPIPGPYLGATSELIDAAVRRAAAWKENRS